MMLLSFAKKAATIKIIIKTSLNSKKNLIDVLKNDEKIGYNHITKTNMDNNKKLQIIKELEKEL